MAKVGHFSMPKQDKEKAKMWDFAFLETARFARSEHAGNPRFLYHYGDIICGLILTGSLQCDIMFFMKPMPYPEAQLNRFMDKMGDAFDYVINDCKIDGAEFVKMFVASTACKKIENGEASYIFGKSGIEIAIECVYEITGKELSVDPSEKFNRSAQYWCGWAVCYYQWWSSRKYADIFKAVSYKDMMGLNTTLHEASVEKIASLIDEKVRGFYPETNLKRIRTAYGCSQRALAEMSGVSLRSIQMYEQRNKDINKAQSESLYCLAKALGCTMEDLIEK